MERTVRVASNRLPITINKDGCNSYTFSASSGGLASSLAAFSTGIERQWYGWPGLAVPPVDQDQISLKLKQEYDVTPIFLKEEIANAYYNGFANSTLWPLFHYHLEKFSVDQECWTSYVEVNRLFARAIAKDAREHDLIWIHDYHLMLLPYLLREELGKEKRTIKIGFFLHIPFPSYDIFRTLSVRDSILMSLLKCDIVGFQTPEDAANFRHSSVSILGATVEGDQISYQNTRTEIDAFPIGIDIQKFTRNLEKDHTKIRIDELAKRFRNLTLILGVDRLDYTKGILQKLQAFEILLQQHPEWIGKVILIQIAVPSRQDVQAYQELEIVVNQTVTRINGKYVSSTRDGMNLVSFEYIAAQQARKGVLVLSEFTGAASILPGAVLCNPWDLSSMAAAVHYALTMDQKQRVRLFSTLYDIVRQHTVTTWGQNFLGRLDRRNRPEDTLSGNGEMTKKKQSPQLRSK